MLPAGALRNLIEEKFGTLPYFLIYALLEWLVILLLFVDGFLAFLSNEIARLFELKTPCLLCTRLDHVLVQRDSNFYYNESICEIHKKDISALAYCHVHGRLSDVRTMCNGCLISRGSGGDSVGDDQRRLQLLRNGEVERNINLLMRWCTCCGEPTRSKSSSRSLVCAPASPRAPHEVGAAADLQSSIYTELKLTADTDAELHVGEVVVAPSHGELCAERISHSVIYSPSSPNKCLRLSKLTYPESIVTAGGDEMIEDAPITPILTSRNKFFGIPLTDAAAPPLAPTKKSDLLAVEPINDEGEGEGDIVVRLKRQVTHDRRSLMALYMELDEERNAAAVAANNAMAMITRLQAEKAAVQMEASQYQRMMEEQAEYDQEAMQMMKDMLLKREEEMKTLEAEIEQYKEKFGIIKKIGSEVCEVDLDEGYQDVVTSQTLSSLESSTAAAEQCESVECEEMQFVLDYGREREQLLWLMRELVEGGVGEVGDEADAAGEVSLIRERLRVVEAESGFLKHAAMTLQRGGEGMKILSEIAQNLRELRQNGLRSTSS